MSYLSPRYSERKAQAKRAKPQFLTVKQKAQQEKHKQQRRQKQKKKRIQKYKKTLAHRADILRNEMTPAELHLWAELKTWKKPYKCRAQHPIGFRIADFVFCEQRIVIEVDGNYHLNPAQRIEDAKRTAELKQFGFSVVRFSNDDVLQNRDGVIAAIKAGVEPPPEKKYYHSVLLKAMGQ